MSYTVTIKDNDTGKILQYEPNVQVIMGAMAIRHDELRCNTQIFLHSCNKMLCGNAYLAIGKLQEDLPKEFPWLIKEANRSTEFAFDTPEEMEAAIANGFEKD